MGIVNGCDLSIRIIRVIETSPIRVSYCCISRYFTVTIVYNSCSYVTRWSTSVIKVGVVDVNECVLSHLKEELAWAVDKHHHVI